MENYHTPFFHHRWRELRSSQPCQCSFIKAIREAISIPVIANGGSLKIKKYSDIASFKEETGCSSVMLARAAQWNPSVFRLVDAKGFSRNLLS